MRFRISWIFLNKLCRLIRIIFSTMVVEMLTFIKRVQLSQWVSEFQQQNIRRDSFLRWRGNSETHSACVTYVRTRNLYCVEFLPPPHPTPHHLTAICDGYRIVIAKTSQFPLKAYSDEIIQQDVWYSHRLVYRIPRSHARTRWDRNELRERSNGSVTTDIESQFCSNVFQCIYTDLNRPN